MGRDSAEIQGKNRPQGTFLPARPGMPAAQDAPTHGRVREWADPRSGRRWLLAVSDHDVGWVDGRPVRLLWFARDTEFWSTELYLAGDVRDFADDVLVEHLDRAQEGWYQGVGSADPVR
jgi:hypothetical protein